jgi:hypothetical protein
MGVDHPSGDTHPVGGLGPPEEVLPLADRLAGSFEDVPLRRALVPADQDVNVPVQGGGEKKGLALGGDLVEQPTDYGQEAHVCHSVGLVEDDHLYLVQMDGSTVDQVGQPARAGHSYIHPTTERGQLSTEADGPVESGDPGAILPAEGYQFTGDLGSQFPGGGEDETGGMVGPSSPDPGQKGDAKGQGLA